MPSQSVTATSLLVLGEQPLTSCAQRVRAPVVLDTNVVLDWMLFADPSVAALSAAIGQRQVDWVATPTMRGELADVLRRGLAARRGVQPEQVLARWDAHVTLVASPPPLPDGLALRCTDPDDQMFLELAHACGARWLISRDRALLRLARRAAPLGIAITVPQCWSAPLQPCWP